MKITFIRLNMFEHISTDAMKPVLFSIIKGLTPEKYDIEFIDERIEKLPEEIDSDIIAFSVETYTAKRAYILSKKYKKENNFIVMGGFHIAVMPDEALGYADSVIIGDAEDTWPQLLDDCEKGILKEKYISSENTELTAISCDTSMYKSKYHGIGVHQFSRGCKFNCGFCSIKTMYKCVRRKSPDDVYMELSRASEKIIFFADDNIFYDRKSALEMFRRIAPLKKKWACQISMDAARDSEILREMKKSGCFLVLIGFESLNPDTLSEMSKYANKAAADYTEVISNIRKNGMLVYGCFVLGCDNDGTDVFRETFNFAVKNNIAVTNFNPLIPMPGTPVYSRMEEDGRLLYRKWWLSDKYRYGMTAFQPVGMTPEQLEEGCLWMRTKFYSVPCILKRLFGNPLNFLPWNLLVFLLANFISRREIHAKQGQILGGVLNETDVD